MVNNIIHIYIYMFFWLRVHTLACNGSDSTSTNYINDAAQFMAVMAQFQLIENQQKALGTKLMVCEDEE